MKMFKRILIIAIFSFALLSSNNALVNAKACTNLYNGTCTAPCSGISSTRSYCETFSSNSPFCKACPDEKEYVTCIVGVYATSGCFERDYELEGYRCVPYSGSCTKSINATYPNGGTCPPCCTRDCGSCTPPDCPAGYTDDTSETSCIAPNTTTTSCEKPGEDCGDDCGSEKKTCYLLETNVKPSMPSAVRIIVDDVTYSLSTNSATPTTIKRPSTLANVQVSVPTTTFPSTSGGGGYAFKGFNDGVNDEWAAITTCTPTSCAGVDGEDFFIQDTTNIQNFNPTSKTILQVLKQKADGKIGGMYYTQDKCDTDKRYSLPIEGYYKVDSIPTGPIELDLEVEQTSKGCTSSTYSGLEINNPLRFKATITDSDSIDEVNALIIWFSKDETVPTFTNITTNTTQANVNDFGVMIRKNAGVWTNPRIYFTNAANEWVIMDSNKLAVNNLSITQTTTVNISFGLEFKDATNDPIGLFNVYGTAVDSYMINNNVVDQSRIQDLLDWGIDLSNPTVNDITQTVNDVNSVYLDWSATDNETSIRRIIINAYRTGGSISNDLEMFIPPDYIVSKGIVIPTSIPEESQIGRYDDTNAWVFNNRSSQIDLINIGENEGGLINTYVTAYDMGCNTNAQYEDINLNPWMTTKGGTVYSTSGITNAPKDVAGLPALDGVFVKLTSQELDTGTELISARNAVLPELLHPELKAVRALSIYDSNDRKSYWFDHFKEKLTKEKASNATKILQVSDIATVTNGCATNICYYYGEGDVVLNSGFNCSKKVLVMSEGDITINPDITSSGTSTGCIFIAKGDIHIGAGTYKTGINTNVHYDYIDAYLIAEGQIIFDLVDTDKSVRDGIEINGGLVAFGNEVTSGSAISTLRNLKLLNISNPTVVVNYDYKYPNMATKFFGVEAPIYKQEIGFKSF